MALFGIRTKQTILYNAKELAVNIDLILLMRYRACLIC